MKKSSIMAGVLALILFVSVQMGTSGSALAQGHRGGPHGPGFFSGLTTEQREAVQDRIAEMRDQGATREEIHTAITEMLEEYGIELPENWPPPGDLRGLGHGPGGFWADLTEDQRQAVHDKIAEMREEGATREEIHTAITEMLEGYGVELPENWRLPRGARGLGHDPGGFWADLTEDQRQAVNDKITEMREEGATREEIRVAVSEMLEGYGIELPENWRLPGGRRGLGPGGFWENLTEEQRQAVNDKIAEMREEGATRDEIRAAVAEMLEGYGIELPEKGLGWRGPRGFGPWGECFGVDLTGDQKKAIREKKREMRGQGANREEIHAAVAAMLESYGIELPEFLGRLTEEQRRTIGKTVREMKRERATCEEIRAAVREMIEKFGYDWPEPAGNTSSETVSTESAITARSYPNPFNPEADIAYTLSVSEKVEVQVYNVSGQLIRTFDMGYQPAGSYSVRWDGHNENGDMAASGVYLYRIEAGPYEVTDRMVLLK